MKVSIITVTYNTQETIEQTINSVLNQTYPDIEYIVVDGMSTDGTWERICKYRDRISVLIHEKDSGLYDAMNKGISKATGDIIGIINGDDWYESDAVDRVVEAMDENTEVVFANMNIIHPDGSVTATNNTSLENIWYKMIAHPTVFVRKTVYQRWGLFDTDYYIVADYDLILRFYVHNVSFKYLDQVICNFRKRGITSQKRLSCAKEVKKVSLSYIDSCPQKEKYLSCILERYRSTRIKYVCDMDNTSFLLRMNLLGDNNKQKRCVFGAGYWGGKILEKLKTCSIHCDFIIDNDSSKVGKRIEDVEIVSSDVLKTGTWTVIIAVVRGFHEIKNQLGTCGNTQISIIDITDLILASDE